ncbi:MAG: exopolysaccharide biosynthesis polyprenyl glycosylphosphotransferase [Lachnospiraceae bacterium]|nr:exopolysaccharide biosynthesis polyprenyl glycosylphosphotransferase [Lachnospiraceae bacterium]
MKGANRYKKEVRTLLSLLIVVILCLAYRYVWMQMYRPIIPDPFWNRGNWLMVALYAIMLYIFTKIYGARKIGDWGVLEIIYSQMLSIFFVNVLTYLQLCLINRWMITPWPMVYLTCVDFSLVVFWACGAKAIYKKLFPPREIIMVYGDHDPDGLFIKMNSRKDKYHICEFVNIGQGMEVVQQKILRYEAVILCDIPAEMRNDLVKYCFEKNIRAYVTPKLSDIILLGADNSNIFDSPLLICKNTERRTDYQLAKRIFDLVIIIPVGILVSPIMLIIAILIKLQDGGPVFYRQPRLTLNGKVFQIYKFRSMWVESEKGGARLAQKHDSRITPVGRVIRAIHFDELPQIINIIKGEMSIVGPRPERPEIAEEYRKSIPEFDFRLKAKAGLTGYAQVHGKYNTSPYDKLKLDLYYIEHQTMLMDIELVLMTIKIVFMKENTEGVDEGQTTAMQDDRRNH